MEALTLVLEEPFHQKCDHGKNQQPSVFRLKGDGLLCSFENEAHDRADETGQKGRCFFANLCTPFPKSLFSACRLIAAMWREISRFFQLKNIIANRMDHTRFYADHKFGLLIDFRSMADTTMHGSGVRPVNTKAGVFLEIDRKKSGSENVKCHVFTISNAQKNIMDRQLEFVQH